MIRRRHEEDNENPDRWLVSYADFITLLFAFFVVMYSVSSVNQKKYKQLSSSISTAFTSNKVETSTSTQIKKVEKTHSPAKSETPPKQLPLTSEQIQKLQEERKSMTDLGINLSNSLAPLISDGKVRVAQNNRGIRIDINDSLLFASGSADLAETAKDVLNEIAELLQWNNHAIQVEGHTDNTPIHNATFFSNWELSAVRASSVVRMFSDLGITDNRLSALGFGSTQPIEDNNTAEGRAKNRHVSIMILYDSLSINNDGSAEIKPIQYNP
jgi:chemotaxis protein MotB